MRFFGYAFLILGFLGMPFYFMAEYHSIRGRVMFHSVDSVRPQGETNTYTWPEWRDVVDRAFDKTRDSIPSIFPPTISMLFGGILLDIAGLRRRKAKDAV
jgi:hypothetical protein